MPKDYADNFNKLQEAIINKKQIKISYTNYNNQISERIIDPIKFEMIERKSNFYDCLCVRAYCNLRKDERVFANY